MLVSKFFKSFLPFNMRRQVRELFIATTMVNFALAMVMIFEPIYLYQTGHSLHKIMLFYLMAYVLYFLIMPFGAKFARKKGYEKGMFVGTFFFIIFYLSLFLIFYYPLLFYISPIILAVHKMFYWPAYHADFAHFCKDTEEGREVTAVTITSSLVYIIGPALAGFIIFEWGYNTLFILTSIIFLASNIPTLVTTEKFKPTDFPYKETYRNLFSKKNRKEFLAYLGFGEEFIVVMVWPIFISLIITSVFDLGMIIALATLITTMLTFYIGHLSDTSDKRKILRLGSAFYSLGWFIRIFIANRVGVFFVDTLSRLSRNTVAIPLMAITYEKSKEITNTGNHKYVMSRVVFFEMSLVIGKILAMLLIFLISSLVVDEIMAFKLIFVLAGGMSLLYLLL